MNKYKDRKIKTLLNCVDVSAAGLFELNSLCFGQYSWILENLSTFCNGDILMLF